MTIMLIICKKMPPFARGVTPEEAAVSFETAFQSGFHARKMSAGKSWLDSKYF